ncbi:DUF1120 domain-containing protein [Herbaspirillum sp. YR522]|uniref:DUF1120 domain-containing protein n=1 Tax=Herbaspirillum sp. YR522 TaxID=1144342 RepID=UPI00026F5367|nr:DUF1120 domain-containing protein [Herbaspirillum sp. YR522]EJN08422.1 Protein of unknown function (DUF1120) [Herbaspirillum sp. YR522]
MPARRPLCALWRRIALTVCIGAWCPTINAVEHVTSARLAVIGEIVPGACAIDLADGGTANYGVIPLSSIPVDKPLHLEEKQIPFTIRCDDPMTIHLSARDMKPHTAVRSLLPGLELYGFGLGSVGDVNIGVYKLRVFSENLSAQDAQRKVVPVDLIFKFFNLDKWGKFDSGAFWSDGTSRLSFGTPGNGNRNKRTPGIYRLISGVFGVQPVINQRGDLPVGRVPLDGLASIDIYYQ